MIFNYLKTPIQSGIGIFGTSLTSNSSGKPEAGRKIRTEKQGLKSLTVLVVGCCLLYFACWIFYYTGVIHPLVLLGLMVPPCLAFLFFAIDRKNGIAVLPILEAITPRPPLLPNLPSERHEVREPQTK